MAERISGKNEMTALDVWYLADEIKRILEGAFFRKIYQWKRDDGFQFIFEFYAPKALHEGKSATVYLYADGKRAYISKRKMDAPPSPPGFCQLLRSRLIGKKVRLIRQHEFDRIIEIETNDFLLVIELIHPGNVILCDSERKIIMPLIHKTWKDREIRPNRTYEYPPQGASPFKIEKREFSRMLLAFPKKAIIFLSVNMGLGSHYAREALLAAGISEEKDGCSLGSSGAEKLYDALKGLFERKKEGCAYPAFVSPFRMASIDDEPRVFPSFSEALDAYFSPALFTESEKEERRERETRLEKAKRIEESQKKAIEEMEKREEFSRKAGEAIYSHYQDIAKAVQKVISDRDASVPWDEIKKGISEGKYKMIKGADEKRGILRISASGMEFDYDIKKKIDENATFYFEQAKKLRAKAESARRALEKTKERVEMIKVEKKAQRRENKPKKRQWFEQFRWFVTSDGFLAVAGKDAETNEKLIKQYAQKGDLVFHADIQGASFVVIKGEDKAISRKAREEAAAFAAANSKAWQRGLATVDVYAIKPEQVLKASPEGINLPKGSFYIDGEREWFRNTRVEIAIGFARDEEKVRVICGPSSAVRKHAKYHVLILPGENEADELLKEIKARIVPSASAEDRKLIDRLNAESIRMLIPSGRGQLA